MSNTVSLNLQLSVREGRVDDVRNLMIEMVAAARQEPGTRGYEWFLSEDGKWCHTNERFDDSAAAMIHLGNFASTFAERFLACLAPTALSVYGEPTTEVRAVLDGLGASYLGWLGGFNR